MTGKAHRVFLDANVLFSASYRSDSRLTDLWRLPGVGLIASEYAVEEARRNCTDPDHRRRLEDLLQDMEVLPDPPLKRPVRELEDLPEKDRPILGAAIASHATHLLTGDRRAFGELFGREIRGVRVLRPAEYLAGTR